MTERAPELMRAAVWYGPGAENFRLELRPRPRAAPREVILKIACCFFCAMHARAIRQGHAKHSGPKVFGRMFAGTVAEVGEDVDVGTASVGTRVTLNPERPCGGCFYCGVEEPGHCASPVTLESGGMAEYVRVPGALVGSLYRLPPELPYAHAAFAETLACVLRGIERASIRLGDTVVIIGAGGVGLSFLQLALRRGASRVIVADRQARSLCSAISLGARAAVNVDNDSLEEVVRDLTGGHGADIVIEAAGTVATYAQSLGLLRYGGTALGFGGLPPGSSMGLDPNAVHYGSLSLVGTYRYHPVDFRRALELIQSGAIDLAPIVTHSVAFERLPGRCLDLHDDPECRALVIDFEGESTSTTRAPTL